MKTSNKLLVVAALLLVTAAMVNALTLKSRFDAIIAGAPVELRDFAAESFNVIELSGTAPRGMGLHVSVRYADRINVQYTELDFVRVEQVGETLKVTIDHPSGYETDIRRKPEIIIECPELVALTAIGTPLDDLDLPADAYAATQQFYRRSSVAVKGFRSKGMHVTAANGMEVTLVDMTVDSLDATVDYKGLLEIRRNKLSHATLTVGDEATVTLDDTQVGTMLTNVAEQGQLILKGAQLTAHGKHH